MTVKLFSNSLLYGKGQVFDSNAFIKRSGISKVNLIEDRDIYRFAGCLLRIYCSAGIIRKIGKKRKRTKGRPANSYVCLRDICGWGLFRRRSQ